VVYKPKDAGGYEEEAGLATQGSGDITAETVYDDWKAGNVFATDAEVIRVLQGMGITNPEAVLRYWKGSDVYPGTAVPVESVITPTPIEEDQPDARTGLTDENLALLQRRLDAQGGGDILRRVAQQQYGLGAGDLSGLTLSALKNPFSRFSATDPIMQFNQPTPFDAAFASFLGQAAPSREQLGTQLSSIIGKALGGEQEAAVLEGTFQRPDAETAYGQFAPAFSAAIQPTVAGVSPRFQSNVQSILQNQFQNRLATDPLRFNTALQVFQDFQNRGFIPQSPVAGP
jgi:hypothetical protein